MKGQYYLTEYLLKENITIGKGYINLLNAPAGSGKTSFIFEKEGIIYNTTKFIHKNYNPYIQEELNINYNFCMNLDRIIYICDTNMLKDKVLNKYKDITKEFDNKSFQQAKDDDIIKKVMEKSGKIKVLTYAQFGKIMSKDYLRKAIYKYFDLVIMDEFHNLFDYADKFDKDDNILYSNIINNLSGIALNTLLVCLTATPYYVNNGIEKIGGLNKELYNIILNQKQINQLRQYEESTVIRQLNPINDVKWLCLNKDKVDKMEQLGNKVLIYTTQIKTCNKYKEMLIKSGYIVESLWTERKMNNKQKELKKYLIENEVYPDNLNVLIINKAYDTGWDLKDNRIQFVIIDSGNPTIQTQVRNRCRHDITKLTTKIYSLVEDNEGNLHEAYSTWYSNNLKRKLYGYWDKYILKFILDEKYLNIKLSKELKQELINTYASYEGDGICNWKSFKKDLEYNNYILKTNSHGTYIYEKDKINNNIEVEKMKIEEKFIKWIENEWDKKRISIQDVKDILDIGTTSFNKMIKSETITSYFKENRYNIGTVKGGKVKYLKKY